MTTYYKVLNVDGSCCHGGHGSWHLPDGKRPGKWMPRIAGEIRACSNGYHVCRVADLLDWLGPAIFTVEIEGEPIDGGNKLVVARARLIGRTVWCDSVARMFAADCAERVLPILERSCPTDYRPRKAILAARQLAGRKIDGAGVAARTAGAAASEAAGVAAARAAARAAASEAAGVAAARAAARAAERKWQIKRLRKYLDGKLP